MTRSFPSVLNISRRMAVLVIVGLFSLQASPLYAMSLTYSAFRAETPRPILIGEGDILQPNEKISIHIKYMNDGSSAAAPGALMFTLPAGCEPVWGALPAEVAVSFDDGHTFLAAATVNSGGPFVQRAALTDAPILLKLVLARPLAPGRGGEVEVLAALR